MGADVFETFYGPCPRSTKCEGSADRVQRGSADTDRDNVKITTASNTDSETLPVNSVLYHMIRVIFDEISEGLIINR